MNKFDPWAYLAGLNIDVMHFGLEAITKLLFQLGHPQNLYKTILIAGTNGKGSTAAMLASILRSANYKVGLYTSPHLIDICERIVVSGEKISRKEFSQLISEIRDNLKQPVTYFELLTAAAFLYFARRKVDIAIMEVGLGGRLDATNVCRPLASIITNISLEHTAYLGKTLSAIAGEKAGIVKRNGICITAAGQKKVLDVFSAACKKNNSQLLRLGRDIRITKKRNGLITYQGVNRNITNLEIPLRGRHQLSNAALALAAIEVIAPKGFRIDAAAIRKGLADTSWGARLEILCREPLFILDGAHNPAGISSLCRVLENDFSPRRLILIFGALADKDYRKMLQKIAPKASMTILPQLKAKRAVAAQDLAVLLEKMCCPAGVADSVNQAIRQALKLAGNNDLICAAGSLYLAGEVKQAFPEIVSCGKKPIIK